MGHRKGTEACPSLLSLRSLVVALRVTGSDTPVSQMKCDLVVSYALCPMASK